MTLMSAKYNDETQSYTEEPFHFEPASLVPGPTLDADIAIVLSCYARAGMLPTGPALLFLGNAALGLFLRRNATRADWDAFLAELGWRHPALLARDAALLARVVALANGDRSGAMKVWRPTMPETCVGSAALELMPASVTVVADAALPGGRGPKGHVRRCDYCFSSHRGVRRVEVAGLVTRHGPPPTFHGVCYAETRMPARSEAYAALGLPPPTTIYADEALDRSRLLPIVADIISQLA